MIIDTSLLHPTEKTPYDDQIYNGLDCCITLEVLDALLSTPPPPHYDFLRSLQGPFLEMQLRGFRIDEGERSRATSNLEKRERDLKEWIDELSSAIWGKKLNPRSRQQLIGLLCGSLRLPERWTSKKGEKKLSMDREALEYYDQYLYGRPIVRAVLCIRDTYSDLKTLKTAIRGGRWFTSWNIAGTDTGRISSSASPEGDGGNLQNITRDGSEEDRPEDDLQLRRMFIADDGKILVSMDRKQSEAREVGFILGWLFDDWKYLDVIENEDIHTYVTKETWPHLPWTGDPKKDRRVAETPFYRNNTYRDMAKKLAHGSSYLGTPFTMSRHAKCSIKFVENFQEKFFSTFPSMHRWHRWVAQELQLEGRLPNLFGDFRDFFDNPSSPETLRKAVAHMPQSSTAKRTNIGLFRVWKELRNVEVLAQGHDSITFQCKKEDLPEVIPQALKLTEVELTVRGRKFIVPGDCKVGFNWASFSEDNPDGLREWKGEETRVRSSPPTLQELLSTRL